MFDERLVVAKTECTREGAVVEVGSFEDASLTNIFDLTKHGCCLFGVIADNVFVSVG